MKSIRVLIVGGVSALLLVGAIAASLWPIKTESDTSCGSFIAASDSVYENAYQKNIGMIGGAAYEAGVYTENSAGLPTGAFDMVARNLANEEVAKCDNATRTTGAIAGALLLLAVIACGATVWLAVRSRSSTNSATPDTPATP